jgi:hypothetical protein
MNDALVRFGGRRKLLALFAASIVAGTAATQALAQVD